MRGRCQGEEMEKNKQSEEEACASVSAFCMKALSVTVLLLMCCITCYDFTSQ